MICRPPPHPTILSILPQKLLQKSQNRYYLLQQRSISPLSSPAPEIRRSQPSPHPPHKDRPAREVVSFLLALHKTQVTRHFINLPEHRLLFHKPTRSIIMLDRSICRRLHLPSGEEVVSFAPRQIMANLLPNSQTHHRHCHH